ncbi:MAG: hypothetical protein K2Q24_15690 [Chitinophagaceae bacterium]|nr:hypothetical protein [Chitinophagaceae bacterium]
MKKYKLIIFFVLLGFIKHGFAQNTGIGTNTPQQKLHVKGNAVVTENLGIGVDTPMFRLDVSDRIRIRSSINPAEKSGIWLNSINNTSKVAFLGMVDNVTVGLYGTGYNNFGLAMNTNSGYVGIGTIAPNFPLDVNGRMRIRSGGTNSTPGIWFNNINNTNTAAFMGTANNNQVGFYGTGLANFGLLMNTDDGEISYTGTLNMDMQLVNLNSSISGAATATLTVNCSAGYKALSGGGGHYDGSGDVDLKILFSGPKDQKDGWVIKVYNSGLITRSISASCICAKIK